MPRALIIVDTQVDFVEGGRLAVQGGRDAAAGITRLIAEQPTRYDAIVATKDWHTPATAGHFPDSPSDPIDMAAGIWPVHCMAGTQGSELAPELRVPDGTPVFLKGQSQASYTGFDGVLAADTPWDPDAGATLGDWLSQRGIAEVDIVGIAYDVCVAATAVDAAERGLVTTVLRPLTAAVSAELTADAEARMGAAGVRITDELPTGST